MTGSFRHGVRAAPNAPGAGEPAGGFSGALTRRSPTAGGHPREAVGALKDLVAGRPLIEIGAGSGILTGQIHRAGLGVTAFEDSDQHVDQLRRSLPAVRVVQADSSSLPLRDGSVEVLVAVLSGDADADGLPIEEIARALVDDGSLVVLRTASSGDGAEPSAGRGLFTDATEQTFTASSSTDSAATTVLTHRLRIPRASRHPHRSHRS